MKRRHSRSAFLAASSPIDSFFRSLFLIISIKISGDLVAVLGKHEQNAPILSVVGRFGAFPKLRGLFSPKISVWHDVLAATTTDNDLTSAVSS